MGYVTRRCFFHSQCQYRRFLLCVCKDLYAKTLWVPSRYVKCKKVRKTKKSTNIIMGLYRFLYMRIH